MASPSTAATSAPGRPLYGCRRQGVGIVEHTDRVASLVRKRGRGVEAFSGKLLGGLIGAAGQSELVAVLADPPQPSQGRACVVVLDVDAVHP